jgi:iron complex outermembrane receptor protein
MAFRFEVIKSKQRFPVTAIDLRRMTSWLLASTMLCGASIGLSSPLFAQQPVSASAENRAVPFSIPAQPLPAALDAFIRATGWQLGYSTRIAAELRSAAVKGTMPPAQALRALLAGTGINIRLTEVNTATLLAPNAVGSLPEGAVPLPTISVIGQEEGTAAQGYKVETAKTTGPWGDKPIVNTPYSIDVTSADLLQNTIAATDDQLFKFNPLVYVTSGTSNQGYGLHPVARGFGTTLAIDGIPLTGFVYGNNDLEGLERVEVFSGASGFLYGTGSVGGMTNYVLKRPTAMPLFNYTAGNSGDTQFFNHLDLGGPIDKEGKFGYRFNAVYQDGDNVLGVGERRAFVSGAVDWHVTDSLKVSLNMAHHDYWSTGDVATWFNVAQAGRIPSASDYDTHRPLLPNWGTSHNAYDLVGANVRWDIDDDTTVRAAVISNKAIITTAAPNRLFLRADGKYYYQAWSQEGPLSEEAGGYLYVDRKFDTFGIQHKLTFGANGNTTDFSTPITGYNKTITSPVYPTLTALQNSAPLVFDPLGSGPETRYAKVSATNIVIGDDITLNRYFSVLAGVNRASIVSLNYDRTTGLVGANSYDKSAVTPTASLIFKPTSNVSLYGTYIEALQAGGTVPLQPIYTNAGAILPPTISKQIEFGAKANVGGVFLTLAAFQIDKANNYIITNPDGTLTQNQDGRQIHKGIEFTATGKVTDDLTIRGGGTYLDPEVTKTNDPTLLGKRPLAVSKWRASLYGEYRLPFLQSLYLTGGVSYVGSSYFDAVNTLLVPAYAVGDVGLRYETAFNGTPVIMRLNVQNVADHHYWIQNGAGAIALGFPRTYTFSATAKF